jgi:hypothetical protein
MSDNDFPGVIPHNRTPATPEVPQMVICLRGNRIVIDVTYADAATAAAQYRGFRLARESGALARLIDAQSVPAET